jgi:hypothetical protein
VSASGEFSDITTIVLGEGGASDFCLRDCGWSDIACFAILAEDAAALGVSASGEFSDVTTIVLEEGGASDFCLRDCGWSGMACFAIFL